MCRLGSSLGTFVKRPRYHLFRGQTFRIIRHSQRLINGMANILFRRLSKLALTDCFWIGSCFRTGHTPTPMGSIINDLSFIFYDNHIPFREIVYWS